MAKAKKEDVFSCSVCGLVVSVDECGVSAGHLICCEGSPMQKGKVAAVKARKAVAAAVQPKAPAKSTPVKAKAASKAVPKVAPVKVKAAPAEKPAKAAKPAAAKKSTKIKK